jgi:multicomponent Na+:H+ antiporter subunit E
MIGRMLLVLWLTAVWVLLWGTVSIGNVLAGLVLGILLVLTVPPGQDRRSGVHPVAILRYLGHLAWALVVATATVARTVLRPRLDLEEGIVAVPLRAVSPVVVSFVANSITLTPGTMTVDIRPRSYGTGEEASGTEGDPGVAPVLFVHCLVTGDPAVVREEARRFEELAVAAFGSPEDRRALTAPPPPWPTPMEGTR